MDDKLDDEEKEITISYETLFDLLKRERDRADLQKLDENFFKYLVDFLKEKKQNIENPSLESFEEKKKLEGQLDNIKKLLIDLYIKREKKIVSLALDKSRTKSTIVDDSTLLKEEKQFFGSLIELFDRYREGVLFNTLEGNLPFVDEKKENKGVEVKESKEAVEKNTKLVRFMHAVPKFVGEELEEYGPFAGLLIDKGRAEEIKSN